MWEYISPHFFHEAGAPGLNNWVFRAFRYTEAEDPQWCIAPEICRKRPTQYRMQPMLRRPILR